MTETIPRAVYTLWWTALIITLVLFVPLSVYLLHRTWVAARSIRRYAEDALTAAAGVAGNTRHIPALDTTIAVAAPTVGVATQVASRLNTAATVLSQRAEG